MLQNETVQESLDEQQMLIHILKGDFANETFCLFVFFAFIRFDISVSVRFVFSSINVLV